MTVDTGGNLWVAEADSGGGSTGRVEVFSPAGVFLGQIPFPADRPTGVAFGGSDNKNLYVTTEGQTAGTNRAGVWIFSSRCAGIR
jgi:sugar lactone lactonase YvrE